MDLLSSQIHEGVMFDPTQTKKNIPMWIVDRVDINQGIHYVAIFNLQSQSIKDYHRNGEDPLALASLEKEFTFIQYQKLPYGTNPMTTLAKQAKQLFEKKHKNGTVKVYKKPIFTTVVTQGEDTFSHQLGIGFYEHEPTTTKIAGNQSYVAVGKPTGVFLSLDRITWLKDFIPTDTLASVLQDEINGVVSNYTPLDTGPDSYFGN